ncbi:MAG: Gfo/Idh/MocA family oxidoreductase [Armatimonadetes bacterium]|nr:Gfo/Idh/MocA family oxidoreductase [Armatimonadota bacterium]
MFQAYDGIRAYYASLGLGDLYKRQVVGIEDDDHEMGMRAAEQFKTTLFPNYHALLDAVDAVIITAENARHVDLTIAAAEAGKHVLCEKPLATTIRDAQAMIDACKTHKVNLMTAFPCRFSPAMVKLKEHVDAGDVGNILAIKGTNRGKCPGGWFVDLEKSGGGAVIDHTVHVVDLMRWLLRSEPVEVYAEISNLMHHAAYDDVGLLTITFDNGVFATLDTSWSRPESYPTWGDVTMDITGTNGMIFMDMFAQNIVQYSDETMRTQWSNWGSNIDYAMIADFVSSVANNVPVSVTGEDGLKALEVALAAYKSSEISEPVKLPLEE